MKNKIKPIKIYAFIARNKIFAISHKKPREEKIYDKIYEFPIYVSGGKWQQGYFTPLSITSKAK